MPGNHPSARAAAAPGRRSEKRQQQLALPAGCVRSSGFGDHSHGRKCLLPVKHLAGRHCAWAPKTVRPPGGEGLRPAARSAYQTVGDSVVPASARRWRWWPRPGPVGPRSVRTWAHPPRGARHVARTPDHGVQDHLLRGRAMRKRRLHRQPVPATLTTNPVRQRAPEQFRKLDALAVLTGPLLPAPPGIKLPSLGAFRRQAHRARRDRARSDAARSSASSTLNGIAAE